jgi:phenylpyruvate tautomerase PptA (4-oxalocrotonate tautomerase family)
MHWKNMHLKHTVWLRYVNTMIGAGSRRSARIADKLNLRCLCRPAIGKHPTQSSGSARIDQPLPRWRLRFEPSCPEILETHMPLITLTVVKPKSGDFKTGIFAAVHQALVASGVPQADRFQRVLELEADDFRFDASYPDLTSPRDENFALIEILFSEGRSVKVKKRIVADIFASLTAEPLRLNAENVMICFKETRWENWVFGGGRFIHT